MLFDFTREIASLKDFSPHFPMYDFGKLGSNLEKAGVQISGKEWFSLSITSALIASVFTALICAAFSRSIAWLLILPLSFGAFLFLALRLPSYLMRKRAEAMEAEMSFALREIVVEARMGLPYEAIIGNVARRGYGCLSLEFGKIVDEIALGSSVPEALAAFSERTESASAKRLGSQLSFCYGHGIQSSSLGRLGDEIASLQRVKMREHSSKSAILGLLFLAIGCIVPALFAAYIIIGSSFLALSFTPSDIHFAYLVAFPLACSAMLCYINAKTPKVISM